MLPYMPILGVTLEAALILSTILLLLAAYRNDKPMCLLPWIVTRALTLIYEIWMISFLGLKMIEEGSADRVIKGDDYIFCGLLLGGIKSIEFFICASKLRIVVSQE